MTRATSILQIRSGSRSVPSNYYVLMADICLAALTAVVVISVFPLYIWLSFSLCLFPSHHLWDFLITKSSLMNQSSIFISVFVSLYVCLSNCLPVSLSVYLTHLWDSSVPWLSTWLSASVNVLLSVFQTLYLSVCIYLYLSPPHLWDSSVSLAAFLISCSSSCSIVMVDFCSAINWPLTAWTSYQCVNHEYCSVITCAEHWWRYRDMKLPQKKCINLRMAAALS